LIVVDSSGWLEVLKAGPHADAIQQRLITRRDEILVPTVALYEVYKTLLRHRSQSEAVAAIGVMSRHRSVSLSNELALLAAEFSVEHKLSMADAIIYASAHVHDAEVLTTDADFKDLPNVTYLPKGVA
jgi:predicted nucleic acid-binding protein